MAGLSARQIFNRLILLAFTVIAGSASPCRAQWRDAIGYTQLLSEEGASLEDGTGVEVAIAEALVGGNYLPDFFDPQFEGKTLIDGSGTSSGTSGHANSVTKQFIGNTSSIAGGVTHATIFDGNDWIDRVLGAEAGRDPQSLSYKIQNNSWIGNWSDNDVAIDILNRVDYVVDQQDVLMVGGVANSNSGVSDALGSSYNALIVGRTSGNHGSGLTTINGAGRVKPDIVAPAGTSSIATPMVSSAAAVLHEAGAGTDAVRSETMRAILMAGATKEEFADWDRTTTRPLDDVFGAGELNIYNSYQILQGGSFAASEIQPTFTVGLSGWTYVDEIAADDTLYFDFEVDEGFELSQFSVSLNWNLSVIDLDPDVEVFDPATSLANLDLRLFNSTNGFLDSLVDASLSPVDNVEHIYLTDLEAGRYTLEVSSDRLTDFGMAWRGGLTAVPEPGSFLALFAITSACWIRRSITAKRTR